MASEIIKTIISCYIIYVAFFIRPFYKMMLRKKIVLNDMQCVVCDLEYVVCMIFWANINI